MSENELKVIVTLSRTARSINVSRSEVFRNTIELGIRELAESKINRDAIRGGDSHDDN